MKSQKSQEIFSRAKTVMPGGVNSPVRSFRSVGGNPFVASHGKGPYIYDVDGNQLIDLVCSWGALIHGHCHPRIESAILAALKSGTSFGITCETEVKLGEAIKRSVPNLDLVRLVSSGTEACMSAIRVARGFTKRDLVLKFDGHYHGHGDSFLVGAGSGVAALHRSESAGIPETTVNNTIVIPFNDIEAVKKIFAEHGSQIACTIMEVVCGNMGTVIPDPLFLMELRKQSDKFGAVLIFDEVMTGFRVARAGVQQIYGVIPDLVTYGKVIGGGMPVGAYGGKKELMSMVAPLGSVYQAGTLSGNPLGAAAGLASLEIIEEAGPLFYQQLDHSATEWKTQLESYIRLKSYPACVAQMGSMVSVFFRAEPPRNYSEAKESDTERFKKFFWALMERGVYYPPSQFEACFLSSEHKGEVLERVIEASQAALDEAFK